MEYSVLHSNAPLIWFLLLDSSTGKPYKNATVSSILRSALVIPVVDKFRDAVKAKYSNTLSSVDYGDLFVYRNKSAFLKENEKPLSSLTLLDGHGKTEEEEDLLIVVVPTSISSSRCTLSDKERAPMRRRRWIELNRIIERNSTRSNTNEAALYSNVTWRQVGTVFNLTNYVQRRRNIDDGHLSFLAQYLSNITKCFGFVTFGNEAKLPHLIAPVLICVCNLFAGEVDMVVEEHLDGNVVKAHGHFEFMLRRGKTAICVVAAKKDDVEQGMAQDLVGCEVVAEVGGLDIVYGIVTNYIQWNFFRNSNKKVEMEECSLFLTPTGPDRDSLKNIAEKIYAILSDD